MRVAEQQGLPPMRPLVLQYPEDTATHEINDQFLFGSEILVAPVVEQGKRHRAVYLPEGTWYDYWTKRALEGGRIILAEAPLDVCPIYVRAGAVIPNYPDQSYVGEKTVEELILDVYPGAGSGLHYQDDGESYAYQAGEYNEYLFTQTNQGGTTIRIEKRAAGYAGSYKSFEVLYNGVNVSRVTFNGKDVAFEAGESRIRFRIPAEEGTVQIEGMK